MMQVGLILRYGEQFDPPGRTIGWQEVRDLARLAEDVGFDTLWVDDHFVYDAPPLVQEGAGPRGFGDAWMLLAALAEVNPAGDARAAGHLYRLSQSGPASQDGRFARRNQWRTSDPGPGCRLARSRIPSVRLPVRPPGEPLRGSTRNHRTVVADGQVDFQGTYYEARECELRPRGPRPAGPPIWIGARGPRMLRAVARHADAFNAVWHVTPESIAPRFEDLEAACREVGRDPRSLRRTAGTYVAVLGGPDPARQMRPAMKGTPEEIAAGLHAFQPLGVDHVTLSLEPWTPHGVELGGRVIEELRRLER